MNPFALAEKLGYRVRFVSHERIKEYIACYRVVYKGREIYPGATLKLKIPKNEIWISDAYREFAEYILFHELMEIKHRYEGYDAEKAHILALLDEEREFGGEEKWNKLKKEINVCTYEELLRTKGIGAKLARRIMDNRPYDRMEDLLKVKGIGRKRFEQLRKRFWCIENP